LPGLQPGPRIHRGLHDRPQKAAGPRWHLLDGLLAGGGTPAQDLSGAVPGRHVRALACGGGGLARAAPRRRTALSTRTPRDQTGTVAHRYPRRWVDNNNRWVGNNREDATATI